MSNRRLTSDEIADANALLELIRGELTRPAGSDRELLFAYRRRLIVRLTHDERNTPAQRNKLKALKLREQNGICPICNKELPKKYAELDRFNASDEYTPENTRLIHHECHIGDQARKLYL
jgi:hypothetical protein